MKKILILLIVLGGLIGMAVVSKKSKIQRLSVAATRDKLLDKLDISTIRKVRMKDGDKVVTLAAIGDQWTVAERSGYPAAFEKIRKTLIDLADQKAGKKQQVGKAAWGDIKLLNPGEGDATKDGFLVELFGEGDKLIKSMVLGANIESSKVGTPASPFGGGSNERFVRVPDDGDTVWVVANQFYDLQPKPEEWIDKSFIDVQKIKTIEVTAPTPEESWKALRKAEMDTEFTLENAKPNESLDSIKAALTSLLSSPAFTDVLPKEKATADFMKGATQVKITTFDGFNYAIKVLTKGDKGSEKYYLTVDTTGEVTPKERPAVKDEKPEDKKKADEEFATKKKSLEEHLEKDKKAAGWVYEVSSYSLGALIKKKAELLKAPPTAGETDKDGNVKVKGTAAPAMPGLPPAHPPISVTTPPVSAPTPPPALPKVPKVEVKPTPDAKASPVTLPPAAPAAATPPAKPAAPEAPKPADPAAPPAEVKPAPVAATPAAPAPTEASKPAPAPVVPPTPAPATPPAEPAK